MEADVLSVREAAEKLGVSTQRVRQLINDGQLPARRSTGGWFVRAEAVADRAGSPVRGRPMSPQTAWAVIHLLAAIGLDDIGRSPATVAAGAAPKSVSTSETDAVSADPEASNCDASFVIANRTLRHRVLRLLSAMPDPAEDVGPWRVLLASRGPAQRMWAHPGLLPRLGDDSRISVGGTEAAVAVGDGLSRTSKLDLYVAEPDFERIVSDYHLQRDMEGQIVVHVVPAIVPSDLAPRCGVPVPAAAAAADLLEEDDPRAKDAALRQLRAMRNSAVHRLLPSSAKRPSTGSVASQG